MNLIIISSPYNERDEIMQPLVLNIYNDLVELERLPREGSCKPLNDGESLT